MDTLPGTESTAGRRAAYVRLAGLVLLVLIAPAVCFRGAFAKVPFDGSRLEHLRAYPPDYVLIGDSMLATRFDAAVFQDLTGRTAYAIDENGSASARWWLAFKNEVVASGVRPKRVFFFFRDRQWSWPAYRTGDRYREFLESGSHDREPELEQVLGRGGTGWRDRVHRWLDRVYPIRLGQRAVLDRLERRVLDWTPGFDRSPERVRQAIEQTFDLKRLRADAPPEMSSEDGPALERFEPDPQRSFLPHVARLAAERGIPIYLVRVKRRPNRPGDVRYDPPGLVSYVAGLRAWAEANGIGFHDFTPDPAIRLGMYADGDHIDESAKAEWTRHFVRVLGEAVR